MEHSYRIAAFDMDGTLLNDEKQITPATIAAMRRAAAAGKVLALNTGRCPSELREYLEILPEVRYVNCVSGALVMDVRTGETIYSAPVPQETVLALMDLTEGEDAMVHLLSQASYVDEDHLMRMAEYNIGEYQPMFLRLCTRLGDVRTDYRKAPFPVYKVNFHYRTADAREAARIRIEEAGIPVTIAYAERTALECSTLGVSKAAGLAALTMHLGLAMDDVIVVGDNDNDRAALQAAGLPIAMGNATPGIKAICKAVVADCNHDGCAEVIERYLLA